MIAAIEGFLLGGGLIVAIGAQNAYILRMGLLRAHVLALCLICAASDALLIAAGVAGIGALVQANEALLVWVRYAGAAFLLAYAVLALRRAFVADAMAVSRAAPPTLRTAVATVLAFTFLNPHVYLDTLVLVGGLSAQYEGEARIAFGAGAVAASFVWFFALGYGARWLAPLFARPRAWTWLDLGIAAIMTWLAVNLLLG